MKRWIAVALCLLVASAAWGLATVRGNQYSARVTNGTGWSWSLPVITSGIGLEVTGNTTTTGDLLRLIADNDALTTGNYINCLGGTSHNTTVFEVGEDGAVSIASAVATTNSLLITNNVSTAGDLVTLTADDDTLDGDCYYISCLGGTDHATAVWSVGEGGQTVITPSAAAAAVDSLYINGTALTTGDAIQIKAVDATLNGGFYLNCLGGAGSTAVFTVGESGVITFGDGGTIDGTTGSDVLNLTETTVKATGNFQATGTITSGAVSGTTGSLVLAGNVSGGITVTPLATGTAVTTIQNQNVSAATITLPSATCTLPGLGLSNAWTGVNTFGVDGTGVDLQLYGAAAGNNLLWDASDNRLEGTGETYVLIGETTTGVNNASPNPMIYGRLASKTTAVTGDGIGVRGNARTYVASPSGNFYGGYFQAGSGSSASGTDGVNVGLGVGALCEFVGTTPAASTTTVADARGLYVSLDVNQDAVNYTQLYGIKVNSQTDAGGTMGTYSASRLLWLENEAVGGEGGAGTGAQIDDAIYVKSTNHSGGIKGFMHGIDFSGATFNASGAEIVGSNSETLSNITNGWWQLGGALNFCAAGGTAATSGGILGGAGNTNQAGAYSLGASGGKGLSFYLTTTSATTTHALEGLYVRTYYGNNATSAAPMGEAGRFFATCVGDAADGTIAGIHSTASLGTGATNSGQTVGVRGTLSLPNEDFRGPANSGTFAAGLFEIASGGTSTDWTGVQGGILRLVISGDVTAANWANVALFDINVPTDLVSTNSYLVDTNATTDDTDAKLRIRINGTTWWIPLDDAAD